jgi:poly(A) polymerase
MAVKLAPSLWAEPGLTLLSSVLGAGDDTTRLVGGAVRDLLAGNPATDIDLATRLLPEDVMARLASAKIKAVPTGIAHGTVTAILSTGPVEITTLRRDVATDGRRATIAYTDDWQADAARRDFTINALSANLITGEVFDYFGGVDDLSAGRVRFIGDPLTRIAEDHLRILRFFRFQARYGKGAPDAASLAACASRANDLMALSRERIADELLKLLALPDPSAIFALMQAEGIWKPVLPEMAEDAPERLLSLTKYELLRLGSGDSLRRMAALFSPEVAVVAQIGARLKLSKLQRKRLEIMAARSPEDAVQPRALAYRIGMAGAIDRLLLQGASLAALDHWSPPPFPLSGGDIVARGIKAGPDVARLLKRVEDQWIAEGFPDATRANAIADTTVRDAI